MFPIEVISSPREMVDSLGNASERNRALLLGLPAILFAVIGVSILLWAKFGIADSLEATYKTRLEKSSKEKTRLQQELTQEIRMLQASKQAGTEATASTDLIAADDPRRRELEDLRREEKVFLEKLIDLNPEESEYIYQLAIVAYEAQDVNRCLALMNLIAPLNEPGDIKAHLWLANFFMTTKVKTRREAVQNVSTAVVHAEQCLRRDPENKQAKQIKATLLYAQNGDQNAAYDIFLELFNDEPRNYKPLLAINKRLKKTDRSGKILDRAIIRFNQQLDSTDQDPAERIRVWGDLTTCYLEKEQFEVAEKKLLEEIKYQSSKQEGSGRVWAERMLANVYLAWSATIDDEAPNAAQQRVDFMRKAYQYNPGSPDVMRQLTRLGVNKDLTIANQAKMIYDATDDRDAPARVLNEVGTHALANSDYESALRYFELARKKSPRDPEILNNLAYTYTVGENPNPKRGLTLIDEALRYLPQTEESKSYMTFFRDTRGQALMQMSRFTEAAAEFERALVDRPDNKEILEALVNCYQASGLDPSAYVERLRLVNQNNPDD